MVDNRISKKDLSVEELVGVLNDSGYSNINIERILQLEFGILNRWVDGKEDISCVALALLRILSTYPWMLKIADKNFEEDTKINILEEVIKKQKGDVDV